MHNNIHSLCFITGYDDKPTRDNNSPLYSEIYSEIDSRLSEGHSVIFAAESDKNQVIKQMVKAGIEAEEYISKNALIVIDKQSAYLLQTKLDGHSVVDPWHALISKKGQRERSKRLLAVVVNEKPLQSQQARHYQKHIEFEKAVGKKPPNPAVEVVCCYTNESLASLPLKDIIALLSAHQHTLHNGWKYNEWTPNRILETIGKGIDYALGVEGAKLVFQTLRLIYKIDEDMIVSCPELFEDTVRKILGKGADSVLNTTAEEIKKQISFC